MTTTELFKEIILLADKAKKYDAIINEIKDLRAENTELKSQLMQLKMQLSVINTPNTDDKVVTDDIPF